MPRVLSFTVPPEYDGKKAITFLRSRCGVSSRLIGKLKRVENGITMDGSPLRTVDLLKARSTVAICVPDTGETPVPIAAPLNILYEDSDVMVINKSPFMAMHPTHNHQGDTLANAVAAHLMEKGQSGSFRAVGRLDKGTSGTVVCALNKYAASKLNGTVEKEYVALVQGDLPDCGTVSVPIYRPDPMKTLRACSEELGVEPAVTHWTVEQRFEGFTLIRLNLETGRTHQIRVHMAHIGHPLAGDNMYGDCMPEVGHQLLHCRRCTFIHPVTGEKMSFTADFFEDFKSILEKL